MTDQNPYRSPPSSAKSSPATPLSGDKPDGVLYGKLLTLATFTESVEAHLFKNELENHGINAAVTNETSTAIFGASIAGQIAAFTIDVMIMETDAIAGLKVKQRWLKAREDVEAEDFEHEIPEWNCECGEIVDAGFAICWNCGEESQQPGAESQ